MKRIAVCVIVVAGVCMAPRSVWALKARTAPKTAVPAYSGSSGGSGGSVYSRGKINRPARSVELTFLNLGSVNKIEYMLSYASRGLSQGAGGAVVPGGASEETRSLYFGTCSHGVCTPHTSITNAQILVTTYPKSGGTHVKRYRVKM